MIGTAATKCVLNADDLAEYESVKQNWKLAPRRHVPAKEGNGMKTEPHQRADNVKARIGLTSGMVQNPK
jgi:hypothetical protein